MTIQEKADEIIGKYGDCAIQFCDDVLDVIGDISFNYDKDLHMDIKYWQRVQERIKELAP